MRIDGKSADVRSWERGCGRCLFPVDWGHGHLSYGRDPLLSCSARPWFALPTLFHAKKTERRSIPPQSGNTHMAWYGAAAGQCRFAYSAWPLRTDTSSWALRLLDSWGWVLNMTMRLLFQSNSLSGCLLETFVVWTGIWGRGRSHLLWNSLPITWSNYCRAKWRASNGKFLSGVSRPSPLSEAVVLTWRCACRFQRQGHDD